MSEVKTRLRVVGVQKANIEFGQEYHFTRLKPRYGKWAEKIRIEVNEALIVSLCVVFE